MKSTSFILLLLLIACGSPKAIIAFDDEQAMCIHGKGIGQDAVLGPATTTPREARVKNLGNTKVSLRIQNKKTIVNTVSLEAHSKTRIHLKSKEVLYLDTSGKGRVAFWIVKAKQMP